MLPRCPACFELDAWVCVDLSVLALVRSNECLKHSQAPPFTPTLDSPGLMQLMLVDRPQLAVYDLVNSAEDDFRLGVVRSLRSRGGISWSIGRRGLCISVVRQYRVRLHRIVSDSIERVH